MQQERSKQLQLAMIKAIIGKYPTLEALKSEVKAADYNNEISLESARHLITSGCFLVYYSDVTNFMRANGGDKRVGDNRNWESYVSKMGWLIYKACTGKLDIYQMSADGDIDTI